MKFKHFTPTEIDCLEEALSEFNPSNADCGNYMDKSELRELERTRCALLKELTTKVKR